MSDSAELYVFGHGTSGQLGLGDDCTDKSFKPERVNIDLECYQIALGDTHSLLLSTQGQIFTTGANDKYQLGINPDRRDMKIFNFT